MVEGVRYKVEDEMSTAHGTGRKAQGKRRSASGVPPSWGYGGQAGFRGQMTDELPSLLVVLVVVVVLVVALVVVLVLVLECVSNIRFTNFCFSRTSTRTSTKSIRFDRSYTPCALRL
jgi:hypothetical protein